MSTEQDPQSGGSYLRDPETGALVPMPAEPTDQTAETGDQKQE